MDQGGQGNAPNRGGGGNGGEDDHRPFNNNNDFIDVVNLDSDIDEEDDSEEEKEDEYELDEVAQRTCVLTNDKRATNAQWLTRHDLSFEQKFVEELVRLVNPRSTVPSQVFHVTSHVITDGPNPFVVYLAIDEATRFVFFCTSRNHQAVVANNINECRFDVDVIAKKMAFLALIQDICYKRVPTQLIYDNCEMFNRRNVIAFLAELGIRHSIAGVA